MDGKSSKKVPKFETEKAADFICQLNNKKNQISSQARGGIRSML